MHIKCIRSGRFCLFVARGLSCGLHTFVYHFGSEAVELRRCESIFDTNFQ